MKLMRSNREGSLCSETSCAKPIHVGDPIAYFGPKMVFGLTCHENEKTRKHLAALLAEEQAQAVGAPAQQSEKTLTTQDMFGLSILQKAYTQLRSASRTETSVEEFLNVCERVFYPKEPV